MFSRHGKKHQANGKDHGTSPLCATDDSGLTVCLTSTVGQCYGSHIIVPGYGFVLNDTLSDFAIKGKCDCEEGEPCSANFSKSGCIQIELMLCSRWRKTSFEFLLSVRRRGWSRASYTGRSRSWRQHNHFGECASRQKRLGKSTLKLARVSVLTDWPRTMACQLVSASKSSFSMCPSLMHDRPVDAVRASRLHNESDSGGTKLEDPSSNQGVEIIGFSEEIEAELKKRGHKLQRVPSTYLSVHLGRRHQFCMVLIINAESESTVCAIKFTYPEGDVEWEPAADTRKEDSGSCVYRA